MDTAATIVYVQCSVDINLVNSYTVTPRVDNGDTLYMKILVEDTKIL